MGPRISDWLPITLLLLFSLLLFLFNLDQPKSLLFDETAYVPAARALLRGDQFLNHEHPPLGKEIMTVGLSLFGDQPMGWRIMSAIFGVLVIAAMYFWALLLFGSPSVAVWVAALTLVNQMVYVQSRVGMLDIFMFAFLAWAFVAFLASGKEDLSLRCQRFYVYLCGFSFGLAMACKWSALFPWILCLAVLIASRFISLNVTDDRFEAWKQVRLRDWILGLAVIPVAAYLLTFIPIALLRGHQHWADIFRLQKEMLSLHTGPAAPHGNSSRWYEWPFLSRPVWYLFEGEPADPQFARAVLFLGNPFVLWSGLIGVVYTLFGWLKKGDRKAFWIFFAYASFYLPWAAMPKPVTFAYYYMPASCVLSLAMAYLLSNRRPWTRWIYLAIAVAFFCYFFPISSAIRIPVQSYNSFMWFKSWR